MAPGELDDGVVSLSYGLLQVVEAGNHVPALPHLLLVRLDHSENSCRSGVLRVLNIEVVAHTAKFQKTKSMKGSLCVSFTAIFTYTSSFLWAVSKMATFFNISDLLT